MEPINDDVPGAGHLHQLAFKHEIFNTVIWASKLSCLSPVEGLAKVQKAQNAVSNCLFAFGLQISPMTNVLLTDLGLSIPPKFFFESFIDKCISISVDSAIY